MSCEGPFAQAKVALEAAERVRWQPIETAPNSCEPILVIGGRQEAPTIMLSDVEHWRQEKGSRAVPTMWCSIPSPPESKSK
jgi:hypothetical protein